MGHLGDDLRGRVAQRPRARWHRRTGGVEPDGVAPPAHRSHRLAVTRQLLVSRARAEVTQPAVDLVGTRPGEEHGAQRGDERQPLPHLHAEPERLGIAAATQQHDLLADGGARHALHPELVAQAPHLVPRVVDHLELPTRRCVPHRDERGPERERLRRRMA